MRLLIWHCRSLSYTDKRRSTRPPLPDSLNPPAHESFQDVVAVMACIEATDSPDEVVAAATAIKQLADDWSRRDVALVPFAHLSSDLASPARALKLLRDLARVGSDLGLSIRTTSFGYHKDFYIEVNAFGHPGSVAYREF